MSKKLKKLKFNIPLIITLFISAAAFAFAIYRYTIFTPNISEVVTDACTYTFSIPTPTPSPSPSPSSTPTTGECKIRFEYDDHQTTCEPNQQTKTITYFVDQLPPGGPYYMQTDWYLAFPLPAGPNHYQDTQLIQTGKSYSFSYEWPGIYSFNPRPDTIEIHLGLNVVDADKNILTPACAKGLDIYWTKWTTCPGLLNPSPTTSSLGPISQ